MLKPRQTKLIKSSDILKEHILIPTGSAVAVQREVDRP